MSGWSYEPRQVGDKKQDGQPKSNFRQEIVREREVTHTLSQRESLIASSISWRHDQMPTAEKDNMSMSRRGRS